MSSMERLPKPFQFRGSTTLGFPAVLSYQAITCRMVPAGKRGAASSQIAISEQNLLSVAEGLWQPATRARRGELKQERIR